jgi:Flp pilus assembly protein TadB
VDVVTLAVRFLVTVGAVAMVILWALYVLWDARGRRKTFGSQIGSAVRWMLNIPR